MYDSLHDIIRTRKEKLNANKNFFYGYLNTWLSYGYSSQYRVTLTV